MPVYERRMESVATYSSISPTRMSASGLIDLDHFLNAAVYVTREQIFDLRCFHRCH